MDKVSELIESGILEMYVLGHASEDEIAEVERMSALHEEVCNEIEAISIALEGYAHTFAQAPDPFTGPFLMAKINYMERLNNGEVPSFPPVLTPASKIADYAQWIDRADLQLNAPLDGAQIHIIGYTPDVNTAIVWLEHGAPPEMHTDELEQFLILEGTCDIVIDADTHSMKKGDVLIIPLHKSHYVKVTSDIPCKILLQRVAA